jgi:hypothetical protein
MSRHSPECSGSIAMILLRQMRSIMVRSRESNGVGRTRGRARIAFPDPAGGAGQNWRADRSSTTRSISAADRRITAHRDPIARTTKVNPLGIYSGSKAAGGRPVCEAVATHMILRTAWIYGAHGQNLVKAILRLAGERPRLRVVADQLADGNALGAHFIFSGGGAITWHGFAEVCSRIAESYGITPLPWREPFAVVIAELRREEIVARL